MIASDASTKEKEVTKNDKLVLRLLAIQDSPFKQLLATLGLLLIFRLAFANWSMSIVLFVSVLFHEAAHAAVFTANHIGNKVRIIFPLGAIALPINEEENRKSDLLPWYNIGWLLQVGTIGNVVLMLAGYLLLRAGFKIGSELIFVNSILAISNLLPVWKLDTAQLYFVIFSSLKEGDDKVLSIALTVFGLGAALALMVPIAGWNYWLLLGNLILKSPWLLLISIIVAGIWHSQGKDDPKSADSKQAMSGKKVVIHVFVYVITVMSIALVVRAL